MRCEPFNSELWSTMRELFWSKYQMCHYVPINVFFAFFFSFFSSTRKDVKENKSGERLTWE